MWYHTFSELGRNKWQEGFSQSRERPPISGNSARVIYIKLEKQENADLLCTQAVAAKEKADSGQGVACLGVGGCVPQSPYP